MNSWAIQLPRNELNAAAALRTHAIEVCVNDAHAWLRGTDLPDALREALRVLPALGRYDVDTSSQLFPWGGMVPVGRIPDGPWTPIGEAILLRIPPALLPGSEVFGTVLHLIRSCDEQPANMLIANAFEFLQFVEKAAHVRLQGLSFALSAEHVLIRGECLPPLRGTHYTERNSLAVPCGYALEPIDDGAVIRAALRLPEQSVAVFFTDQSYALIEGTAFVPATRSNVRESIPHAPPLLTLSSAT